VTSRVALAGAVALTAAWTAPANAFVLAEHTRISRRALGLLAEAPAQVLEERWATFAGPPAQVLEERWATFAGPPARAGGDDHHLCRALGAPANGDLAGARWCVGFATLPALAADHACSPGRLMTTLARAPWALEVMQLAVRSEAKLAAAKGSVARTLDARRDQHLELQIIDDQYVPRARDNDVHFQLPRSVCRPGKDSLADYLLAVTEPEQVANATASYIHYHAVALELARESARRRRAGQPEAAHAAWAFFNESFALHFLEDAFSAGHFVGRGTDLAEKLGTHDYYSQNGIDALTWSGERYAAHGDAFLSDPGELDRIAGVVATSLGQLATAFADPSFEEDPVGRLPIGDRDFDICTASLVPRDAATFARSATVGEVLRAEPIPATEEPALPRFRTELGINVGPSATLDGVLVSGVSETTPPFAAGRARIGARIGLGVTDLLTRSEDGNAFVEAIVLAERGHDGSRSGLGFRVHAPFAYVPFDGLVFSLCAFFSQSPGCVTASRRAAAGSLYRINPSRRFGQFASGGLTILRDVALLFSNEGGAGSPTRRDLLLSLANLRTGTDYAGRIATHIGVDLGLQWRHEYGPTEVHSLGGYLSLFTDTPYYLWP
jgi:hypothetical protein